MVRCRVMFGEVIGTICLAFTPDYCVLAFANTVADPVENNVDRLGPFLIDSVGGNAASSAIVGSHGSGGLAVAHFFEGDAQGARLFTIEK
jgi:hypothetical protein